LAFDAVSYRRSLLSDSVTQPQNVSTTSSELRCKAGEACRLPTYQHVLPVFLSRIGFQLRNKTPLKDQNCCKN